MSLRPGLLWLTLNLALIIHCLSRNNIFVSIAFTPYDDFAYPRLKTTYPGHTLASLITQPYGSEVFSMLKHFRYGEPGSRCIDANSIQ
jgi:hypothetical protein